MIGRATPPWVYAVVVVAVLAATFAVGWTVNGWRWEARHATAERTHADALAASQAEAMRLAAHLNRRVAGIEPKTSWRPAVKRMLCALILMPAVAACASLQPAPLLCPPPPAPPAWVMEAPPNLPPMLGRLISTSEPGSTP